jgi:hypothetical protein
MNLRTISLFMTVASCNALHENNDVCSRDSGTSQTTVQMDLRSPYRSRPLREHAPRALQYPEEFYVNPP